ncbi:hypothetical protein Tco_1116473 [Tanacetum coccineum]
MNQALRFTLIYGVSDTNQVEFYISIVAGRGASEFSNLNFIRLTCFTALDWLGLSPFCVARNHVYDMSCDLVLIIKLIGESIMELIIKFDTRR